MSPFLAFLYALFGVGCALGLRQFAAKRGRTVKASAWVVYLIWYIAVITGFAFTVINFDGRHSRAGAIGCVSTIIVAVVLGLVVYRMVCPKARRMS